MAETLYQTEDIPADYPEVLDLPCQLDIEPDYLWQRMEHYVAHRWTPREVTWLARGAGEWRPPLTPATIDQAHIWTGEDWEEITLSPAPLGFVLPSGRFKIVCTVGADNPLPAAVEEAFRRMVDYVNAGDRGIAGASSFTVSEGDLTETVSRNPAFVARALINSGAADLLRAYRRV